MSDIHYQDATVTLHAGSCLDVLRELPDNSVDSVCCDPPYGLGNTTPAQVSETVTRWINGERDFMPGGSGFMGKAWDAFVPPVAVWDDCIRILKPGGHLLAFSGSRTYDLMALAIRLAGFDIRDGIAWLYGNGFPKSLNVSDAMERWRNGERYEPTPAAVRPGVYDVTTFLREARDRAGWTNRQIDSLFGTNGMAGHWTSRGQQPAVPSTRQWQMLKEQLGFGDDLDALVEELGSTERPAEWGDTAADDGVFLGTLRKNAEYERVSGWGTALKPAFEPVVVARKPIPGTVAANILTHGTGGLNLDACRVEMSQEDRDKFTRGSAAWVAMSERKGQALSSGSTRKATNIYGDYGNEPSKPHDLGRWPTNVALDASQADDLDRQGGENHSRYFPSFRYEPKADQSERVRVDGVAHPTVKPLALMRWLVRLATPPGGTVLEPFAGSGTTVEACILEGFKCIAIEREVDYLPLIEQRVHRRRNPVKAVRAAGEDMGLFEGLDLEGGAA